MKSRFLAIIILSISIFSACNVVKQANELTVFTKCDFRISSMDHIKLAGVDIDKINKMSDLSFIEITKITSAIAKGYIPFIFNLNIEIRNPNSTKAALNKLDWILYIDDREITRGVLDKKIEISPNDGISILPIKVKLDLLEVLTGKSANAMMNFAMNLSGQGEKPTRIMLKAKPMIYVSGTPIKYPGYIKIKTEFTSQ